jgi:hypothetical protein
MTRLTPRWMLFICLMAASPAPIPSAPPATGEKTAALTLDSLSPEVHLRRIHLVRPDLIPYPIAYAMVC